MRINFKRRIFFSFLLLSYLLLSYIPPFGWWYSSFGTILIILFSYFIWDKDFLKHIGLQLDLKTFTGSLILAAFVILCALMIMKYIAARDNVQIRFTNWRAYYHDIFYIFNEEIVIGAILLFALVDKRKIHPIIASVGLAVFFALIHFVFYRWIFTARGIIGISTLTTLFFIGFVRNSLILQTRHIGYSWALHFGWMAVMFGSWHVDLDTNMGLTEPVRFNAYLGSVEMLIISGVLAVLCLIYCMKKVRKKELKN
jgi:hypothetical protein